MSARRPIGLQAPGRHEPSRLLGTSAHAAGRRLAPQRSSCAWGLSRLARTVTTVHTFKVLVAVSLALLDTAGVVWGANGIRHVVRVLHAAPPTEARRPRNRLEQLHVVYASRFRGWVVVFSAAVVGAAVSDYDRDPKHGLTRMLGLFLFVTAGLVLMAGVSVGRAGKRAVKEAGANVRGYGAHDLLISCIVGSMALAFALIVGAAALM
jgi:hypothetical protein